MKLALALLMVLLVATPAAAAKGVASADICGAAGCRALDPHGALDLNSLVPYGAPVEAPRGLPFYRLRLAFAGPEVSLLEHRGEDPAQVTDIIYVPAVRAARLTSPTGPGPSRGETWLALATPSLRTFRRATAGLKPIPAAALERAGSRPIAETARRAHARRRGRSHTTRRPWGARAAGTSGCSAARVAPAWQRRPRRAAPRGQPTNRPPVNAHLRLVPRERLGPQAARTPGPRWGARTVAGSDRNGSHRGRSSSERANGTPGGRPSVLRPSEMIGVTR